jgi:hypothetical protein
MNEDDVNLQLYKLGFFLHNCDVPGCTTNAILAAKPKKVHLVQSKFICALHHSRLDTKLKRHYVTRDKYYRLTHKGCGIWGCWG